MTPTPADTQELKAEDLPPFYRDADAASLKAQRRFIRQFRIQLSLLVIAAIAGVLTLKTSAGPDWAGVIAAVAFAWAILSQVYTTKLADEKTWYDGRAAAESAKTLAWRFAVCGAPFPASMDLLTARKLLASRLREVTDDLKFVDVLPIAGGDEVTEAMLRVRNSPTSARIAAYRHGRVEDQQEWYADKARINAQGARLWMRVILGAESFGVMMAVLKATETVAVDVLGVAAAVGAAAGAWLQVKQHRNLASAYSVASRELRQILTSMDPEADDNEWSAFVDECEEAISREHTMWIASRQRPRAL